MRREDHGGAPAPDVLYQPDDLGRHLLVEVAGGLVGEQEGGLEARLTGPQGSGILTSMVKANALLIIPEGQHETPEGALASALVLDDPRHQAEPPF